MEPSRLLACLRHDAARLREVAADRHDAPVPSCPGWTMRDLVDHVATVYQHKTRCLQLGEFPRPWPPEPTGEEPVDEFDRSLAELLAEFGRHDPADPARTWHDPDQSVRFWIRRMAQETVIHRVDGELAAGEVTAIAADLALDGVDEVLAVFLGWGSTDGTTPEGRASWPGLAAADGRTVEVRAGEVRAGEVRAWSVTPAPSGVQVVSGGTPDAAATVTGDPGDVLLWLWRRTDDTGLTIDGDPEPVGRLRELMYTATQ